ncbi:MAG TPA: hypothetical protein VMT76_14775 [Puia sp.]|nr:hypothetical protein [Puia sp.]
MFNKKPFDFIQQKIQELNTALFFPETGALFNIPNYLVNNIQTDSEGNIWFIISKPAEYIDPLDRKFHCKLDFFKKGTSYYVKVNGTATIFSTQDNIAPSNEMLSIKKCLENKQMIAVKVEIEKADYFVTPTPETRTNAKKSLFMNLFPEWDNMSFSFKTSYSN